MHTKLIPKKKRKIEHRLPPVISRIEKCYSFTRTVLSHVVQQSPFDEKDGDTVEQTSNSDDHNPLKNYKIHF